MEKEPDTQLLQQGKQNLIMEYFNIKKQKQIMENCTNEKEQDT